MFAASKRLENGICNDLQSLKMFYDMRYGKFSLVNQFNYTPNSIIAEITPEEALDISYSCINENNVLESCELEYVDASVYDSNEYNEHECVLAYVITFKNCEIVIVDAVSGHIIGNDLLMSEQARCYGALDDPANPYGNLSVETIEVFNSCHESNVDLADDGLDALGYNVTLSNAYSNMSSLSANIANYLNINNAYAFYFTGHGSSLYIGNHASNVLYYQNVSGNWHFVYLDACYSATNTNWANAFHIYGYSNRAFLGWSAYVSAVYSNLFNIEFWPYMDGYHPVQSSAVAAAAEVPGAGTTPIRFYGDTSYKGTAWS